MIREHTLLRNRLPALLKQMHLLRHITQSINDLFIAVQKRENRIWDVCLAAEIQNQMLCSTEVVSRDARIEVVDGLELQATMEEVQPGRAVDVHGCAKHFLREGLVDAHVGRRHGEVRECDLYVQRRCHHVGHHDESQAAAPVRNGTV